MDPEEDLRLAETLLQAAIDHLETCNRLLERPLDDPLFALVSRMRDEQVRRVDALQEQIQTYRTRPEAIA